jgi:hydrogenase maturation protease
MKRPTIVLGLGNPLMSDEGIGIYLINKLAELSEQFPEVEFFDAGTGGITLLHLFEGRDRAIIIDCAFMDEKPGRIRRFTPDQVQSVKQLAHQSLHEQDIMKIIAMAKLMEQCPEEVILFGIQPKSLEQGEGISSELEQNIENYIKAITDEL